MRAKFLALTSATGLGLMALTGFQSAAQAHEVYRYRYFRVEHRDPITTAATRSTSVMTTTMTAAKA